MRSLNRGEPLTAAELTRFANLADPRLPWGAEAFAESAAGVLSLLAELPRLVATVEQLQRALHEAELQRDAAVAELRALAAIALTVATPAEAGEGPSNH